MRVEKFKCKQCGAVFKREEAPTKLGEFKGPTAREDVYYTEVYSCKECPSTRLKPYTEDDK